MPLTFLRHYPTAGGEGHCYGSTDLPLAPGWETAVAETAAQLPEITRIVTSPLSRCRDVARAMAGRLGLPVVADPDIREMDFGSWEMTPWNDIPRPELDAWAADLLHAAPHGGETVAELRTRVERALARDRDTATLWVSHAGVYRAALACLGAEDPWNARLGYGEVVALPNA